MAHYIDKDNLETFLNELRENSDDSDFDRGYLCAIDSIFGCYLNTLEVKEMDLNEDINDFINEEYHYTEYEGKWIDEKDWRDSIQRCAKHFFELGLKVAQEGEDV